MVFPDVDVRDAVRSAAYNLAGASSAGIRLEIQEFLRQSLRAFESIAYLLKQKHPGLKRNVKFDDSAMNLVMDIKLDATSAWKKMRPDQFLEANKGRAEPSREGTSELDSAAISSMLDKPQAAGLLSDDTGGEDETTWNYRTGRTDVTTLRI